MKSNRIGKKRRDPIVDHRIGVNSLPSKGVKAESGHERAGSAGSNALSFTIAVCKNCTDSREGDSGTDTGHEHRIVYPRFVRQS